VTVEDRTIPELDVVLSPDMLWPPNHRMVEIVADIAATDNCGTPAVGLALISSNEPDDVRGGGDGHASNGIEWTTKELDFRVRAERAGRGSGRVYSVVYAATDASGNATSIVRTVVVPHHQQVRVAEGVCWDAGPAAASPAKWPRSCGTAAADHLLEELGS
jgi:hypothetical protein